MRTLLALLGCCSLVISFTQNLEVEGRVLQIPINPVVAGSLGIGSDLMDVQVAGSYAYVLKSNSLRVVDISDPAAPEQVGSLSTGYATSIHVAGRYLYYSEWAADEFVVVDISDPSAPTEVGALPVGGRPLDLFVSGRYGYLVDDESDDLKVIDIADPTDPTLVSSLPVSRGPTDIYVAGTYAYILDPLDDHLMIVDVSTPDAPMKIDSISTENNPNSIYVSGRYAYITTTGSSVQIIDISDPGNPTIVKTYSAAGFYPICVHVSGNYAYVGEAGGAGGGKFHVINVADPDTPMIAGTLNLGDDFVAVFVAGRYAYLVDAGSANDLTIVDISGGEYNSLTAHSLETGNLQVRNDIVVQGELKVNSGLNVGSGGIYSDGDLGVTGSTIIHGNLGIGRKTPSQKLDIFQSAGDVRMSMKTNMSWTIHFEQTESSVFSIYNGGQPRLTILADGKVGIGTENPTARFHTVGTVRFSGLGAGTLETDANGNITASSDIRLKHVLDDFPSGMEAIQKIDPILYRWGENSGLDQTHTYAGFSAQNVWQAIPEAVRQDNDGYLTLSDRPIIASLVNAVKELAAENRELKKRMRRLEAILLESNGQN